MVALTHNAPVYRTADIRAIEAAAAAALPQQVFERNIRLTGARHAGPDLSAARLRGLTRRHRGNFGVYGVFDQMLWRQPSDPNRTMSVFGRALFAPQADRNFLRASLNLGVTD